MAGGSSFMKIPLFTHKMTALPLRYKAKAEKNAKKAAVEIIPKEDELDDIFHTITQDELKQAG
jgi:hypothetical protein